MHKVISLFKWIVPLIAAGVVAVAIWLYYAPPALIRVGSNYAAKIVCSNVFLAGRGPGVVLAEDVQAPGHPLLKLMRVRLDGEDAAVRTGLFGVFGDGLAVYRGDTGCAAVPDGDLAAAQGLVMPAPVADGEKADLWSEGDRVDASSHPQVAEILDNGGLIGPRMRAVIVVRDGRIIGERFSADLEHPDQPLLGWSMTKTVTAAIIGTLVKAGQLSVDEKGLFPEWEGDARADISIADLLGMQSGLEFNESYGGVSDVTRMLYLEPDMASFVAAKPLAEPVGEVFNYASGTSVLLSRIWQDRFDDAQEALEWPRKALFGPLGMDTAILETDARGTFVGSSNMYASAYDWARFAQLLLQDGVWRGERILPEGWVDWMRMPTKASGGDYGRHVWLHGPRVTTPRDQHQDAGYNLPDDAYWVIGHDGQTITIIPSKRMAVVRLGLTPNSLGYKPQALVEALAKLPE